MNLFKRILPKQEPNIPDVISCSMCNSIPKLRYDWDDGHFVFCENCQNRGPMCGNKHRAVSRWNRREIK